MKNLRQIVENIKGLGGENPEALQPLLWKLICYSPKMPSRLHQQDLLDAAEYSSFKVYDQYFSKSELRVNCFKWGKGPVKILLTHGWGSKAIDFSELIHTLLQHKEVQVIAFDAPGNGSSEGALSNLILYVESIKQIQLIHGTPDVMIGHSLGGMANIRAIQQMDEYPKLLISIAPLVKLRENFKSSMDSVSISEEAQQTFFSDFEALYGMSTDEFTLDQMFSYEGRVSHHLFYEASDAISPAAYIENFLAQYPSTTAVRYTDTTHARIIIDARVISEIDSKVKTLF
ncbi:alpha/beta hydrolase [Pedobacter metabolipauper]|uniref:Alpha/beta hydrolase family protein n=1 Tax=Pedobacter metabolipauper TaxID=425513 RepID=A0A4R6SXR6_9SPHI|nr:alpha/beta hydrolase [Pedobacter metabolipauper]TDQ10291.1 alpha/beta hydrolase family protein [Pedobacter metabolipauper]